MQQLHWTNYTKKRIDSLIDGLDQIHKAAVEHSDLYPRNMMVVESDPERMIWIDFDRAQTFNRNDIKDEQKARMELEKALVVEICQLMVSLFPDNFYADCH